LKIKSVTHEQALCKNIIFIKIRVNTPLVMAVLDKVDASPAADTQIEIQKK